MPINLDVKTQVHARQVGFGDALSKDLDLKESPRTDAVATLKKLSTYIRDGSGQLRQGDIRIVNTTNSKELAFRFKSFGWGQQYRKDRTADALVGLLEKAGVADARQKVDDILKPAGAQAYGRLSAQGLNRLLQSEAVQQALNGQQPVAPQDRPPPAGPLASFDQRLDDLHQQVLKLKNDVRADFQPPVADQPWQAPAMGLAHQAKAAMPPAAPPPQPNLGAQAPVGGPAQAKAGAQAQPPVVDRTQAPLKQVETFMSANGFTFPPNQGLAKGGFGTILMAQSNGVDQVVKVFQKGSAGSEKFDLQTLDGKRTVNTLSELYASYLSKSRDARWERPAVIAPSAYIVQSAAPQGFELIGVDQIRARARNTKGGLKCVGLVMDKAAGVNMTAMMGKFTPDDLKRGALSGLKTLRSLNERGFVHFDIKPANMNYDRTTGQIHFFDTGAMFKIRRAAGDKANAGWFAKRGTDQQRKAELPFPQVETKGYRNKEVAEEKRAGTQADLHAFALSMLQAAYPALNPKAWMAVTGQDVITASSIQQTMERLSQARTAAADQKADALAFLKDVGRPDSYANFIMTCLNKADSAQIPVIQWANREFSKQQLTELMDHPALK